MSSIQSTQPVNSIIGSYVKYKFNNIGPTGPIGIPGSSTNTGSTGPTGNTGPIGPTGPNMYNSYGSFLSTSTQTGSTGPSPITYTERSIGNINVSGAYPTSIIVAPVTGIYKILFSAQCYVTNGKHYLEIWPVINGVSVPTSNTRIRLNAQVENCLTVEYFLQMNASDQLEFYMISDDNTGKVQLLCLTQANVPPPNIFIPIVPSIIVTMMLIG